MTDIDQIQIFYSKLVNRYRSNMESLFNWFLSLTPEQLTNIKLRIGQEGIQYTSIRTIFDDWDDYYLIMSKSVDIDGPSYWMVGEEE